MVELEKGPQGRRRGRGAHERILGAAQQLFRRRGINTTGMDELCSVAQVSKRTAYQHFASKDDLVVAYLRRNDLDAVPTAFDRADLSARERLLAVFERPLAGDDSGAGEPGDGCCPFIAAAIEIADPTHPARQLAADYKRSVTDRLTEVAAEAGATDAAQLGQQLALLLDGASARTRVLGVDAIPTAVSIAATLIDAAIPASRP